MIKIIFNFFLIGILSFSLINLSKAHSYSNSPISNKAKNLPKPFRESIKNKDKKEKEPESRAMATPLDELFSTPEYPGLIIGLPNQEPESILNKKLWQYFPNLKQHQIKIYGWLNPSLNLSSSKASNFPMGYDLVPNRPEFQQLVLNIERNPNTVQTKQIDWGFRITNLYGVDYRNTIAQGILSAQFLKNNRLYGYDPGEFYAQLYFPHIAKGMLLFIGRFFSLPDIESQLAPENYLFSHSIMGSFDINTQTGVLATFKLNDQWSVLLGANAGGDVAPWAAAKHIPTGTLLARWVSQDNNDSIFGGINSLNNGHFRANHDNLQQFDFIWTHRFTKKFFTSTELYYVYQFDAVVGGTCVFGPFKYGSGGGCGEPIPGRSWALGAVNFLVFKVATKDFLTFRTDYLDDPQGERTGFATQYMSFSLGLNHQFCKSLIVRPEIRYEFAFKNKPYDNGTKSNQISFNMDTILRF